MILTIPARITGVKADAKTAIHRNPVASPIAVTMESPRTARFTTDNNQSSTVRIADAAKTIAYCFRKPMLVKFTVAVLVIASDRLLMTHCAASAQPRAMDPRGSVMVLAVLGTLFWVPGGVGVPFTICWVFSQASFIAPINNWHGSEGAAGSAWESGSITKPRELLNGLLDVEGQ
ncbi:hypothetical protein [Catenulispora sp. EB89]|uniref:hypothetical protein n=1 Tax=Catenulispora sp. EB89 TaxID=3156257 RepID=UPI0035139D71